MNQIIGRMINMKYEEPNILIIMLKDDIIFTSQIENVEDPFKDMDEGGL